jgi:hypothetical protein
MMNTFHRPSSFHGVAQSARDLSFQPLAAVLDEWLSEVAIERAGLAIEVPRLYGTARIRKVGRQVVPGTDQETRLLLRIDEVQGLVEHRNARFGIPCMVVDDRHLDERPTSPVPVAAVGIDLAPRFGLRGCGRGATHLAVRVDLAAGFLHPRNRLRGRQGMEDDPTPGCGEEAPRLRRGSPGRGRSLGAGGKRETENEEGDAAADGALHGRAHFPAARGRSHPDRGGAAWGKVA